MNFRNLNLRYDYGRTGDAQDPEEYILSTSWDVFFPCFREMPLSGSHVRFV